MLTTERHALYLGLNPPLSWARGKLIHLPIIQIIPRALESNAIQAAYQQLSCYTHLIFTSQSAVKLFYAYAKILELDGTIAPKIVNQLPCIAVGKATARAIEAHGGNLTATAQTETAEGLTEILQPHSSIGCHFFWPHAAGSRAVLMNFFKEKNVPHTDTIFYETCPLIPKVKPDLSMVNELIFTSPSTIDAFLQIFGAIPKNIRLTTIGPITQSYLEKSLFVR